MADDNNTNVEHKGFGIAEAVTGVGAGVGSYVVGKAAARKYIEKSADKIAVKEATNPDIAFPRTAAEIKEAAPNLKFSDFKWKGTKFIGGKTAIGAATVVGALGTAALVNKFRNRNESHVDALASEQNTGAGAVRGA
jgi:F0F1-type ATP synthase membrane subunit c/vacuolar-type H+-ATPase subunit K